jgi:uncharacterized membrane protein YdbT with pleckstrin-like domain
MADDERLLQPGETIAYRGRLHWVLMLPGASLAVVSVALGFVGLVVARDGFGRDGLLVLSMLVFLVGGLQVLRAWIRRMTTGIIVTSQRVIVRTGLAARKSIDMNLSKIESVAISQSPIGRLLDYGDVVIRGVGAGLEPVTGIAAPLEFRSHIHVGG